MSEIKNTESKLSRPPLPPSRNSLHHRSSHEQPNDYQDTSVKEDIKEASEEQNAIQNPQELIKHFEKYAPESADFDVPRLRESDRLTLKRYKDCNYYGEYINQKRQGKGIMLYKSGRLYEGEWEGDLKHGSGYERFSNGSTYTGAYVNGKPEGKGIFKWPNGEVYEGEWVNGQKHGSGMWTGGRGDSYIGEWRFGMAEGYGVHTWINGDVYEGQFKTCLKHGHGLEKFANGDRYVGGYVNGKPDGVGEYFWANGSYFKGSFKNGLRHGQGLWKRNLTGETDMYEGAYINDKKNGYGVFTWAGGNIYKGEYFEDLRHGYGQMYWSDGSCYKGSWQRGVQHGDGVMIDVNGEEKQGKFEQNIMVVEGRLKCQPELKPPIEPKHFKSRLSVSSGRPLASITQGPEMMSKELPKQLYTSTTRSRILPTHDISRGSITVKSNEKMRITRRPSQHQKSISVQKSHHCQRCAKKHLRQSCSATKKTEKALEEIKTTQQKLTSINRRRAGMFLKDSLNSSVNNT